FVSILLSNCFNNLTDLHYALQYLANFSITRFAYEAMLLLEYGFGRCNPDQVQLVLFAKSLHDSDYHHKLAMLGFNVVFWHALALWMLVYRANPREDVKQRSSQADVKTDRPNFMIIPF